LLRPAIARELKLPAFVRVAPPSRRRVSFPRSAVWWNCTGSIKQGRITMSSVVQQKQLDTMDHVAVSVTNIAQTVDWYKRHFQCQVAYQDETWALVEFANIRLAFVLPSQHPDHFAVLGDPSVYGQPKKHRDGTSSVYIQDPNGNNVEILAPAHAPTKNNL
jgi:catechol 2,3-dioxygenase-like lactoylglutathione lyase family enzyme